MLGFARGAVSAQNTATRCHTGSHSTISYLVCGAVSAQNTAIRCHTGSHSTLSYLVCGTSSSLNKLVLATRCHLVKIKCVLFPLTALRSLSFLMLSFTKINISSYPVVHLPLTFA